MSRSSKVFAAPVVFALAAFLAWLTGSPADPLGVSNPGKSSNRFQRHTDAASSDHASAVVMELERVFLLDADPPPESRGEESMERSIYWSRRTAGMVGGGMGWIEASMDWAEESPEEMFSWLMQRGPVSTDGWSGDNRCSFAEILFENWAEQDLEAALAAAATISNRKIRKQALLTSLEVMAKDDPSRARQLMTENLALFEPGDGEPSFDYYGDSTCDLLLSLPSGATRTHLLAKLLGNMSGWYEESVAERARSVWREAPDAFRRELVAAGFASDPDKLDSFDGLEELLRERAETADEPAAAEKFIRVRGPAWAKSDLPGALAWTQEFLKGKDRVDRGAELFKHVASEDFDEALRVWQTLPDSILKARAAGAMFTGVPAERRPEAKALVESLPPHDRRQAWQVY